MTLEIRVLRVRMGVGTYFLRTKYDLTLSKPGYLVAPHFLTWMPYVSLRTSVAVIGE